MLMKNIRKTIAIFLVILLLLSMSGCFYTQKDVNAAYEKGYEAGYDDGYNAIKPLKSPSSGTILEGIEYVGESEITIKASAGESCVVCVKDAYGATKVAFFVKAGEKVTVGVPCQLLNVYFASGKTWYGYGSGLMFGDETSYSKDTTLLDFYHYDYEYTLYPVTDGNFTEAPSDESEFF